MGLFTDRYVTANVSVGAVFLQEAVPTDKDFLKPLQNLCVVNDLVLY